MKQLIERYHIDKYYYIKTTPSTNSLSINNPNQNCCIYTYNQSQGRGQIGRKWYCNPGKDLATSFFVNIGDLKVKDHFTLNIAVSLSIYDSLIAFVGKNGLSIKWPNDIYFQEKKLAGILIQNQIKGLFVFKTIIGIGINVNSLMFPSELPNPTSIDLINNNGSQVSKLKLLQKLAEHLKINLGQMTFDRKGLESRYKNILFGMNEMRYFEKDDQTFEAKIIDVSQEGKLLIDTAEGIQSFSFREVNYVI